MSFYQARPSHGVPLDAESQGLLWTHVVSDGLTSVSYWAIAFILVYLVYWANREHADEAPGLKRLPYPWLFVAFGLFILACGTVHFLLMWSAWQPVYATLGAAKAFMAVASVGTAIALPPLVPRVLRLLREARLSEERQVRLEMAHSELREAHARVKEYDELKSQFFANVSHELRTPLSLILGPVEKLIDSARRDAERRRLEVVRRNARLLRRHVDDLLDIARLEAGALEPAFQKADLAELVRTTAANFDGLALERAMTFEVEAPGPLPAEIDVGKVQRILLNLLANAFKFTPEGGAVRVAAASLPQGWARLEVRDSGPGIPHEQRASVFERFRQAEGGATRRFGGAGLGLAITKEFAELHGGRVEIGEAPEGGARLRVELPLRAPAGAEVREADAASSSSSADAAADRLAELESIAAVAARDREAEHWAPSTEAAEDALPARVLVVEDNPEMRRFLAEILSSRYRVSTASDGEEALRALEAEAPDLVLTDVMMPRMSGDELVREVRRRGELRDVPIVVLTAKADDELRIRLLRAGAQDYLVKPFAPEEVEARIGNLVQMKRSSDTLRRALHTRSGDLETLSERIVASRNGLRQTMEEARRARIEAEAASRAKSEFLAVMSHELRTPLNAILGYNDLLAAGISGPVSPEQKGQLGRIRESALHLLGMIEQILELTREDASLDSLTVEETELADIVRQAVEPFEESAAKKGLQLVVRLPERPASVRTDAAKLRQILWNLLSNAVKFTPEGDVELAARLEGEMIVVRVRDTGVGIRQEDLREVFEPFWQAESGPIRTTTGLGLGLAITERFADLLGGEVEVESSPGAGSVFTVRVPARLG